LFAGHEHEQQVKRLAAHFEKTAEYFQTVEWDTTFFNAVKDINEYARPFSKIDLGEFHSYEEAYHHLIWNIVVKQVRSTNLVLKGTSARKIFVDGGFGKNKVYMTMLANGFPGFEVYTANVPQASALGAGLAIHKSWNKNPLPADVIQLKRFTNTQLNYSS